jgi:hypothetical protein
MRKWNKIEDSVEELIKSNCSINEFKAKVLTSAILDILVQEGLVIRDDASVKADNWDKAHRGAADR